MKLDYFSRSMPLIDPETLQGKTIQGIDASAFNCINLLFTDGTEVCIEAINGEYGLLGVEVMICNK